MGKDIPIWALGAMSGTSLDGVDAAMLHTDGETIFAFGDHAYRAYSDAERDAIKDALGRWQGDDVTAAQEIVQTAHQHVLS
ncbi:MAG: anhydro-N-acetylmuramic acid kinase, partial [Pseudomonadota bacterium]